LAIGLSSVGIASAADSSQPQIPDGIKQATGLDQGQIKQIDDAVAAVTNDLSNAADPVAQSADRRWLIKALSDSGGNPGSSDYLDAYAKIANQRLLAMATQPNADFRAKIEAGLAAASIANASHNTEVVPLVTALLQDKAPAVAYAAMQAVTGLLPTVINEPQLAPTDQQFIKEIVDSVVQHSQPTLGGPIVKLAYDAMAATVFGANPANGAQISQNLVPLVLNLEEQRIALYKATTPENPQADYAGLVILFDHGVWAGNNGPGLAAPQQKQVLQLALDLIGATTQKALDLANNPKVDIAPFVEALDDDGKVLRNFADPNTGVVPDPGLYNAALGLAGLAPGSGSGAIQSAGNSATTAIKTFADSKVTSGNAQAGDQ
jgi:hypothetical protein